MRVFHGIVVVVCAAILALCAGSTAAAPPIAWYKLDETSGTVAADSSGNGNTGAYVGGPTLGVVAVRRFGAFFASNGQYLSAPASATLNTLGASNADFTVAFWIKPNGMTGGWRPMFHKGAIDNERGPGIWLNPGNNRVHFRISTTANYNEGTDSVAALPNAAWSHLAFVKAGNKWRCYVNGVLDTEFTLAGASTGNSGPLYVGDDPWYTGCPSWMDDVRVFTSALTIAEIKSLYGIVGHWKLDETSGTSAADSTNTGNTGAHANGPVIVASGLMNGAVNFDGTDDYIGVPASASLVASDAVAISAWIRPTIAPGNLERMIVNKEGEYEVALTDTGEIKWAFANTSPGWAWHQTGIFVPNDNWSHVVVSYDGAEAKTFLNGQLAETYAATGTIGDAYPALNELRIGGRSSSPAGKNFAGVLDDVHLYTRGVTAAEVANLHALVGFWKFAEGAGAVAADSTLLANNAALSGGAAWATDCAGNKALATNGAGGVAQTGSPFDPPSEGAVAFWMQPAAGSTLRRVFGNGGDWECRHQPDGTLVFDLCGDGGTTFCTTTPLSDPTRWYHIVAQFDSALNTYEVYVDGVLHKSGTNAVDLVKQPAAVLSFGTRTGAAEYWQGALRDFRVHSRKLRATEIAELYGLVGHWKLDESSGSVAADSSGLGNSGSVSGTVSWIAGKINNSHQFNYTNGDDYITLANSSVLENVQEGSFSLAAWFKPLSVPPGAGADYNAIYAIIVKPGWHLGLHYTNGRQFGFDSWLVGNVWSGAGTSTTYAVNAFYHVAAVVNRPAGTIQLYVNGVLANSTTFTAGAAAREYGTVPWRLGISDPSYGQWRWPAHGVIDDARIYNRPLCPGEIQQIYNLGAGGLQGVRVLTWVEIR